MRRMYWILVLLCGTIVFTASVPPVDDPNTAYNEADSAMTVSLPSATAANLVLPVVVKTNLARPSSVAPIFRYAHFVTARPVPSVSSLQQLLCTFLI
jgi:hypothetical protein